MAGPEAFPAAPEIGVTDYGEGGDSDSALESWGPRTSGGAGGEDDRAIRAALRNIADAWPYWSEIWDRMQQDLEFCYVKQWDDRDIAARERQGRPWLTINHVQTLVGNVVGEMRQNRFSVKVSRKSGLAEDIYSAAGQKHSNAEVMAGIVRDVEQRSFAKEQYLLAAQHACESGLGFMKLSKRRPVDDPLHVELRLQRVQNRFSVIFDPYAHNVDYLDARWAVQTFHMSRREYEERFGEDDGRSFSAPDLSGVDVAPGFSPWWTGSDRDEVRVVEYYWKKPVKDRVLIRLVNPAASDPRATPADKHLVSVWLDEVEPVLDDMLEAGWVEIDKNNQAVDPEIDGEPQRHKFDSWVVMAMQFTSARMLHGPVRWEGSILPLFLVRGRCVDYDGKTHYASLHRYAQDSQRMSNFWASAATERVAQAPKDEYVVADRQLEGHEDQFDAGGPPRGKRVYKHVEGVNPPRREQPPQLPTAEISLMQVGRDTIKETTGLYDANIGRPGNEVSGRAIQARQHGGQVTTYEFMDNLASAIRLVGQAIVDMAPKIMGPATFQRIVGDDGSESEILLNHKIVDRDTGDAHLVGSLDLARYEVSVDVGPSYATQREEFVAHITELGKNNPEAIQPVLDLFVRAMDIPFAHEMARRFKHLIPRHMLTEEERAEMPEPEPTAEQKIEMAKSEAEMAKAEAAKAAAEANVRVAEINLEEQKIRLDQQVVRLEQEKIDLETEKMQLEQEKAKLAQRAQELDNAERRAEADEEVGRRSATEAAKAVDRRALP